MLLGVVALGALLRLWDIGGQPLWLDEAFSVWVADRDLSVLLHFVSTVDHHPPLYYLLLHGWQRLFGDSAAVVRLPSAVMSIAAIPILYQAGRILVGRRAAISAAALLAVSSFHVRYGQEARMYALMALLGALVLWSLAVYLADSQSRPRRRLVAMTGLAVSQAALMWTHNTAAYLLPVSLNVGVLLPMLWRDRESCGLPILAEPGFLRGWTGVQVVAVALWLPWLPSFVHQAGTVYADFWIDPLTPYFVWLTFHNFNLAYPDGWFPGSPWWDVIYWALALAGLYALRRRLAVGFLLAALSVTPAALEITISFARPVLYDRTLIWTTLPYFLLIGAGLDWVAGTKADVRVRANRWRLGAAALLAAGLIAGSAWSIQSYFFAYEKENWPALAAHVGANAGPDDLILFNASWAEIPFTYYARTEGTRARKEGLPVRLFDGGALESRMTAQDVDRMRQLADAHDDVWLIYAHEWYTDPAGLIPDALLATHSLVGEREFNGPRVLHFRRSAEPRRSAENVLHLGGNGFSQKPVLGAFKVNAV